MLIARVVPAIFRARRGAGDGASRLLALAVRGLPADRGEWGAAMLAELAEVRGRAARWSFCLGCASTAALLCLQANLSRTARGGAALRVFVLTAVASALGLGVYALARYPELRSRPADWASICCFVLLTVVYGLAALMLSHGHSSQARTARRYGFAGGLLIGAAWLLILVPSDALKGVVALPLTVALLGPVAVALLAARSTRDARAATAAALWSGLVGGLLVFIVWVTAAYVRAGRPYDTQLVRDFHQSGYHSLAAYAVGDDLGAALSMLTLVPLLALALGSLSARLVAARAH